MAKNVLSAAISHIRNWVIKGDYEDAYDEGSQAGFDEGYDEGRQDAKVQGAQLFEHFMSWMLKLELIDRHDRMTDHDIIDVVMRQFRDQNELIERLRSRISWQEVDLAPLDTELLVWRASIHHGWNDGHRQLAVCRLDDAGARCWYDASSDELIAAPVLWSLSSADPMPAKWFLEAQREHQTKALKNQQVDIANLELTQ